MAKKMTLEKLAGMMKQAASKNAIEQLSRSTKSDIEQLSRSTKSDIEQFSRATKSAIEQLARMVKRGFDETASKQDLVDLQKNIDARFETVADVVERTQRDVSDVKVAFGPLMRAVTEHEERVQHLERRLVRVERKVGLVR